MGGATYLKFRRALKTADASASDACLSEDQAFAVVYAYGQVAPDLTHEPASSLENIPQAARTAPDFYKPDELKFHGGGIGTSFAGRGQLGNGQTNFFVAPEAGGGACEASELDGFACQREYSAAGVFLHWNPPDGAPPPSASHLRTPRNIHRPCRRPVRTPHPALTLHPLARVQPAPRVSRSRSAAALAAGSRSRSRMTSTT